MAIGGDEKLYKWWGARYPEEYRLLSQATDPENRVVRAVQALVPLAGKRLVDIGAGDGNMAAKLQ